MSPRQFRTKHVVPAANFESYPLEWDEIFGRKAHLGVEIGFGNGEFLVNWAKQQCDWNFVGIDLSIGSTERLQKRLMDNSINNVRIINDDARFALRELFFNDSVEQVKMNFPDPWPKERHKERRMLRASFIQILAAVLKIHGRFELVTDQLWLVEETRSLFLQTPFFTVTEIEKNPNRLVDTKYEKKWRKSGGEIFRIESSKEKNTNISRILENPKMPHKIIKKSIRPEQIQSLAGAEHSEENTMFVVKEIFADYRNNNYLLRMITKDIDYQQKFFVLITNRKMQDNVESWLVKLDDSVRTYRTPAVKIAVQRIGEILSQ